MEWWNNMSDKEKSLITYHNFENRSYESLTGLEIEKLWNLEFKK